jgi:hypothetical protein
MMRLILAIILITILIGVSASAEEITTLRSLVEEALENNPQIKAARLFARPDGWD